MSFTPLLLTSLLILLTPNTASAIELAGLVTYNMSQVSSQPSNFVSSDNGIGYAFFGRVPVGPGKIETGFLYASTGITQTVTGQNLTTQGSYWILPLMYRFDFFPPFFSIAAGLDYAVVANNEILLGGSAISSVSSGYKSHWGFQVGMAAVQDIGENLGVMLDVRYRGGLAPAIAFQNNGGSTKYNFWVVGLGIQKRLE